MSLKLRGNNTNGSAIAEVPKQFMKRCLAFFGQNQ
jgi:hypothetical protein